MQDGSKNPNLLDELQNRPWIKWKQLLFILFSNTFKCGLIPLHRRGRRTVWQVLSPVIPMELRNSHEIRKRKGRAVQSYWRREMVQVPFKVTTGETRAASKKRSRHLPLYFIHPSWEVEWMDCTAQGKINTQKQTLPSRLSHSAS